MRELLINAAKHAKVSEATLSCLCDGSQVTLVVGDDGCGFDTAGFPGTLPERPSFGLRSIYERITKYRRKNGNRQQPRQRRHDHFDRAMLHYRKGGPPMIRIILVDDHTMVREALRVVLEQDSGLQVVAEAGDGETALRMAEEWAPDVVVMDVALPGQSGIEITRRLLAKHPDIKVLALSTYLDRRIIQQMLDAGACGYIAKSTAGTELKQGIHSVFEGRKYLCSQAAALVAGSSRPAPGESGNQPLSRRELQVATLLAEGKTAPEIAAELYISQSTVDVHRRNLMRKLELHNVVDLTKYAIRTGLILP